jgi:hypothetical protein
MGNVREDDCSDYQYYADNYENDLGKEFMYTVLEDTHTLPAGAKLLFSYGTYIKT